MTVRLYRLKLALAACLAGMVTACESDVRRDLSPTSAKTEIAAFYRSQGICASGPVSPDTQWQQASREVVPVAQAMQGIALERLADSDILPIDEKSARLLSGRDLSKRRNYYVLKAGYWGPDNSSGTVPANLSMDVDIDAEGTAFVVSFRITSDAHPAEFAAVLATDAEVRTVVSRCMAIL